MTGRDLNPTLVAILAVAFLVFGLAVARAVRAEASTRWPVLITVALAALLVLPWAASTPGRLSQLALAAVIALVIGGLGWAIARLRRRDGAPGRMVGRQNGNEPR
jgi:hypothetical protein